jgi:deoxyadenosine/deoxycytidine kinase
MGEQIHILGTVGAGKSSLCRLLSVREQIPLFPEPVESNPYLNKFYENPSLYAFPMQIFLMHSRYKQHKEAEKLDRCIMDMSIYGNDIFAELQYKSGYMSADDFNTYMDVSNSLKSMLEPPKLVVYLQCSVSVAVKRIMKRGRPAELKAPLQYWYDLNEAYEKWYNSYNASKKILINVDNIDFVNNDEDEDYILDLIMEALKDE